MAKSELLVEKINLLLAFVESDIAISIVNDLLVKRYIWKTKWFKASRIN